MARADLLLSLVRAANAGNRDLLRRTLEALVAEERAKQHHVLADRLESELMRPAPVQDRGTAPTQPGPAIAELTPSGRGLKDLILTTSVQDACHRLIEEQVRADLLRSHGLEPRHRVLFAGPPGNGKTSLADALAYELAVPLMVVRYESLIGSFLGETASRLRRVFEFARNRQCLLFLDEFDTLGKERGDEHETGEIKRVVSSLLLQIDALPSYVVVVVATNHPELLDRAVWRRFQLRLWLDRPTEAQRVEWFERAIALGIELGMTPSTLASKFPRASYSDLEVFTSNLARRHVLSPPGVDPRQVVRDLLEEMKTYYSPTPADSE